MSKTLKRTLHLGLAAVMLLSIDASATSANNNVHASRIRTSRAKKFHKSALERAMTTMPKRNQKNAKYIRVLVRTNRKFFNKYPSNFAPFTFGEIRHGKFRPFKKYVDMGAGTAVWMNYKRAAYHANIISREEFGHKKSTKRHSRKPVKNTPRKRRGLMLLTHNKKTVKKAAPANHMTLEQGLITPVKSGKNASAINKLVKVNRQWVAKYGQGMEPFLFGYEKNGSFRYHPHYFGTGSAKAPVWKSYKNVDAAISDLDSWSN